MREKKKRYYRYCEINTLTEINDLRVLKIYSINMCQKCSLSKTNVI